MSLVGVDWFRWPNGVSSNAFLLARCPKRNARKEKRPSSAHDAWVVRQSNGMNRGYAFRFAAGECSLGYTPLRG